MDRSLSYRINNNTRLSDMSEIINLATKLFEKKKHQFFENVQFNCNKLLKI